MQERYSKEVKSLFGFGATDINSTWPNYLDLFNLDKEHIVELLEIVTTFDLSQINVGAAIESYAPMHAWRALGQLRSDNAVLGLLYTMAEEINEEAIWYTLELPKVIGLIGPKSIKYIETFLDDSTIEWSFKVYGLESLVNIVKLYPESRNDVIKTSKVLLSSYNSNSRSFNGCILKELAKINAVEFSETVESMIAENKVDFDFVSVSDIEKLVI